jgi:hypothetical protein
VKEIAAKGREERGRVWPLRLPAHGIGG